MRRARDPLVGLVKNHPSSFETLVESVKNPPVFVSKIIRDMLKTESNLRCQTQRLLVSVTPSLCAVFEAHGRGSGTQLWDSSFSSLSRADI